MCYPPVSVRVEPRTDQAEELLMTLRRTHTGPDNPLSRGTLEDLPLPVRARLAAAWTSFMFLYIYVDYLALYKPGVVDGILAGTVHEFETGPTFVALALTLVAVPIVMIMLSATLPATAARILTLIVATLYIPVTVYNAAGESWSYSYFYGFSIGLELLLLAFILRSAWSWPRREASPTTVTASHHTERAPQQA
jgi:hypothetical protein